MREVPRVALILTTIAMVALALAVSLPTSNALVTTSAESKSFVVVVSRLGFNGTANKLAITVDQGDLVKITFVYGDTDLADDNPHVIAFEHYGIQSVKIGKANPTAVVEFVADASGSFLFYCDVPCLGMENLSGHLIVMPGNMESVASTLDLASLPANNKPNSFLISATVKDMSGAPVASVPVRFYENTTFGELLLDTVATNPQGVATLNYTTSRVGNVNIIAESQGNPPKALTLTIPTSLSGNPTGGNVYVELVEEDKATGGFYGISYPPNLAMIGVPRTMNIMIVIVAAVVILSVWSTYGYVWRQLANLPRHGALQTQLPSPQPMIPMDITPVAIEQVASFRGKMFTLLIVTPLLGVGDLMLVNNLGLTFLWQYLAVLVLALLESAGIIAVFSGLRSAE